jgi:hypothetical protein
MRGRKLRLHAFGEFDEVPDDPRVHMQKWADAGTLDSSRFHAALIYYDPATYSDQRLKVGYPTKLATYVDWSLPIFSNRAYISREMLAGFDLDAAVLNDPQRMVAYAKHLEDVRSRTLPERYAGLLAAFIRDISGERWEWVRQDVQ